MRSVETNIWLRNTGEQLVNVGDQISVQFNLNSVGTSTFGGLFLSSSLGSTSGGLEFDVSQQNGWANANNDASFASSSPSGFATMTITKTSDTTYQAVLSGGGLSGNWTQTASAPGPLYFGLDQFSGAGPGGGSMDNLVHNAVATLMTGFTDNFSSPNSAANYTKLDSYNGGATVLTTGSGATIEGANNSTTYYLRNTGEQFRAGDTVSLELTTPVNSYKGLGFATALSTNGGANPFELFINSSGSTEGILTGSHNLGTLSPSPTDPLFINVSRGSGATGDVFNYSISGGGLSSPFTGSTTYGSAGAAYYFGLGEYNGTESFARLTLAVPEPSSLALAALCAVGVSIGIRRRRS